MKKFIFGVLFAWLSTSAYAIPVTNLLGDKDCFGTGGACVEDGVTWLPGGWSITATADDPAFTDRHISTSGTTSWTHDLGAGAYSSASLSIRTVGIADIYGPYDVFIDGTLIGAMPLDGYGHILVETFTFGFDASLLSDGLATVSFTSIAGDSWAIDYSEITAETTDVPEPASLALLGIGLIGLGISRRRRKV